MFEGYSKHDKKTGNDRLKALHVHDNDAVLTAIRLHILNYGLDSITNALAKSITPVILRLRLTVFIINFLTNSSCSAKYLHDIGRLLVEMVEKAKE